MGDRCWLEITFSRKDKDVFEGELGRWDMGDLDCNDPMTVTYYEANYAFYTSLQALAARGFTFTGSHGPGGEYSEGAFAAYNNEHADIETINGHEAIRINNRCQSTKRDREDAKRYFQVLGKAMRAQKKIAENV